MTLDDIYKYKWCASEIVFMKKLFDIILNTDNSLLYCSIYIMDDMMKQPDDIDYGFVQENLEYIAEVGNLNCELLELSNKIDNEGNFPDDKYDKMSDFIKKYHHTDIIKELVKIKTNKILNG